MSANELKDTVPESEAIRKAVMLVQPSADSISEVGAILLKATKGAAPRAYGDETESYLATVDNLLLDWMAEGKHKELRELTASTQRLLSECSAKPGFLSTLAVHDRLAVRLEMMASLVTRLLTGDNMAKYMGVLSGSRRENWRGLLLSVYEHGDGPPIRKSQIDEFAPDGMKHDAVMKAVDSLVELGLFGKQQAGPKNVQIELTWAGRRVAQAWLAAGETAPVKEVKRPSAHTTQDVAMLRVGGMLGGASFLPGDMIPIGNDTADCVNMKAGAAL